MSPLYKLIISFKLTILAIHLTTWTLSLNMFSEIFSLHFSTTPASTLHIFILTTSIFCEMIINVVNFTLPHTTSPFVCTEHLKALNFSVYLFVGNCNKVFTTTHWTDASNNAINFLHTIKTRLTENMSTTYCQVRVSTGKVTNLTNDYIWNGRDKLVLKSRCTTNFCHVCFWKVSKILSYSMFALFRPQQIEVLNF